MCSAVRPLHMGPSCRSNHNSHCDQSRIDTDGAVPSYVQDDAKLAFGSPVSSCSTVDSIPRWAQDAAFHERCVGDDLSEPQHAIADDVLSAPPSIRLTFKEIENYGEFLVDDGFMLPPAAFECDGFLLDDQYHMGPSYRSNHCSHWDQSRIDTDVAEDNRIPSMVHTYVQDFDKLTFGSTVSSCSTSDFIPRCAQDLAFRNHCDGDELCEPQDGIVGDVLSAPPPVRLTFQEIEDHGQCLVDDGFMLPPAAVEFDGFWLDHGRSFSDEGLLMSPAFARHTGETVDAETRYS